MKALDYAIREGYLAVKKTTTGTVFLSTTPPRVLCDGNPHLLATTEQGVRDVIANTNVATLVDMKHLALVFEAR